LSPEKFQLQDDGAEIDCKWYRSAIEPGVNADAQIALVNSHLGSMGKCAIDDLGAEKLRSICQLVQMPDVIPAFMRSAAAGE
jgi:hypothetical protein